MITSRLRLLSVLLTFFSFSGYTQEITTTAPVVEVPPSPDAAHLGTYGDFTVSKTTGSADVSFPIITLQEGGITIPINLSYQSSGLRVDDRPSWVGMGWVLSTGGVISRTMRGRHDDSSDGFLRNMTSIPVDSKVQTTLGLPPSSIRTDLYLELDNITKNFGRDYEPDAFSFNFPGHGGSFFFGNDGETHCVEHAAIKIRPIFGSVPEISNNNIIIGWRVIDEAGLVYTFNALEFTETRFPDRIIPKYISSWYLTSIHNSVTKATATFTYDNSVYNYTYSDVSHSYSYSRKPHQSHAWTVRQLVPRRRKPSMRT
jgi:hypothetical protein